MKIRVKLLEFDKPDANGIVHKREEWEKVDFDSLRGAIQFEDDELWLDGELDMVGQVIGIKPTKHNYLVLKSLGASDLIWQDAMSMEGDCWDEENTDS